MTQESLQTTEKTVIRTPDQRLRVFISSTMQELASERAAVYQAISQLHLIPVLFESGARPHPPREVYRAYLSQSHIFIGIYWQSYGWVAPGMTVSGLEDEFQLSTSLPRLIYIKSPAQDRDPRLAQLLSQIKEEDKVCYKHFSTLPELQELVKTDLVLLLSEQFERSQESTHGGELNTPSRQANLPPEMTLFIGREKHIATVSDLLQQDHIRLVTLTGAGGVGKTRLALKVAAGLIPNFRDGVWLVELAPIFDSTLFLSLVAETLGLREEHTRPILKTLTDHLAGKDILLILDNCEHLLDDVTSFINAILGISPNIHVLATSREPLGVTGEMVWGIPPLSNPRLSDKDDLEKFVQFESVQLFVDRALAAKPDFSLTEQNAGAVAKILNRLDGIPLAIELAAARVRMLSLEEISNRLENSFQFLKGNRSAIPRQQTLEALIEWSYVLLSIKESLLFQRLSVFSGGWTLQAAEQVCAGGMIATAEIIDLLCSLIDKSLTTADVQNGCERYTFLETIRHFAQDRLTESGEKDEYLKQHAEYFTILAENSYGELWGAKQKDRLCQLGCEMDNFRTAFNWLSSTDGHEEYLLRMAGSLWRFWEITGLISEGRTWLELALAKNPAASPYLRANGLRGLANLTRNQGDYTKAMEYHRQSLALFRALDLKMGIARELNDLGEIEWLLGNYEQAVDLHTKSLKLRREINDTEGIAVSLEHLGNIARDQGQYRNARVLLENSLRLFRQSGDKRFIGNALKSLGMVQSVQSEYSLAISYYEEALGSYHEINDKLGISNTLNLMGEVAKDRGDFKGAENYFLISKSMKQEIGDKRGVAQSNAGLAEIAILQGRYSDAIKFAHMSLEEFRNLGAKRGMVVAYVILAYASHYMGQHAQANSFAGQGWTIAQDIKAPRAVAYSHGALGLSQYAQGNLVEAEKLFQEALVIFLKYEDRRNIANTLINLAHIDLIQGDLQNAEKRIARSLSISHRFSIRWSLAYTMKAMGMLKLQEGNPKAAKDHLVESLRLSLEQENQRGIVDCLKALAGLYGNNGQLDRSTRLLAAAKKISTRIGLRLNTFEQQEYDRIMEKLCQGLASQLFEEHWLKGTSSSIEQLFQENLDATFEDPEQP
jgi:predicted ATPase